ncbi:hypothetical protein SDC9_104345 [bioreactor metagenome]|uniref:Tripartite tricarboxylate transporter family receptor n=1 Tax=bioreactor metagenome TaxID=1076179 RepID=A0A645B2Y5_9ZZZZ
MKKSHLLLAISVSLGAAVPAQAFPDRPVTVVVPFGAGSSVDIHSRDFALAFGKAVKQPVIVENKAGAEGSIGAMAALNAAADGQTLMFTSSSIPVLDPVMKKNMSFDPVKDFTPICTVGRTNSVLNITGDSPIKSATELIAAAKAQPGKLTFAYASASTRLAGELFQQSAGIKMLGVPYKASVAALADVAAGQVDLMFIDEVSAAPFYKSGKLRPLAVSTVTRSELLPDVPTGAEVGIPDYRVQPWFGIYVAAKTPPALVIQLRELVSQVIKAPETAAQMKKRGLVPFVVCGGDMVKLQADELTTWREVTKKAGIEPQ